MRDADKIRLYGKEKYVLGALGRKEKSFSIRAGDVVRELKMSGRTPAVCSALKSREFLQDNNLRLVAKSGPKSGQSTTVVYTYEFVTRIHLPHRGKTPGFGCAVPSRMSSLNSVAAKHISARSETISFRRK